MIGGLLSGLGLPAAMMGPMKTVAVWSAAVETNLSR